MIQSHSLYHCKCLEYIGILNGMGKLNIFSRVWIEKRSKGKGLWCCNVVPCKAECVVHLWLQYLLCYRSGQFQLKLADILSLKESNSQYSIFKSLRTITNATTHNDVAQQLGTLTAYSQMCYLASDHKTLSTITWNTYFSRYGMFSSLTSTLSYSFVPQRQCISAIVVVEVRCLSPCMSASILMSLVNPIFHISYLAYPVVYPLSTIYSVFTVR